MWYHSSCQSFRYVRVNGWIEGSTSVVRLHVFLSSGYLLCCPLTIPQQLGVLPDVVFTSHSWSSHMSSFLSATRDFVKVTRKIMLSLLILTLIIVKQLSVRLIETEIFFSPSILYKRNTRNVYLVIWRNDAWKRTSTRI